MKLRQFAFLFLVPVSACAQGIDSELDTATQSQAIINGTEVISDTLGTPELKVLLNAKEFLRCSGTLITPRWMLTANHCVTVDEDTSGGTLFPASKLHVRLDAGINDVVASRIVQHPWLDAALVHLSEVPLDKSGVAHTNPMYKGSTRALEGQALYTQGWGHNFTRDCSADTGKGSGILRSARLPIWSTLDEELIEVGRNALGQVGWHGDSGSSLFKAVNGRLRPASVTSYVQSCSDDQPESIAHVRGDIIRGWVEGVTGTAPANGNFAGYERSDGVNSVVYVDSSNQIKELSAGNNGLWTKKTLTTLSGSPASDVVRLAAYVRVDGINAVVYRSADSHIREIRLNSAGQWRPGDLSVLTDAPPADTEPTAYVRDDGVNAVLYRGTDNHIYEISLPLEGDAWDIEDLTDSSESPTARGTPMGYVRADGISSVVFTTGNGHIYEILHRRNGGFWSIDLTAQSGAPALLGGTSPHPYSRADGVSAVVFTDENRDIQEIRTAIGSQQWYVKNLSTATSAPTANSSPRPYVRADQASAVVYVGTDRNVYEISLQTDSKWKLSNLSTLANAPDATFEAPSGYVRAERVNAVLFRSKSDSHVIELSNKLGKWVYSDLSALAGGT